MDYTKKYIKKIKDTKESIKNKIHIINKIVICILFVFYFNNIYLFANVNIKNNLNENDVIVINKEEITKKLTPEEQKQIVEKSTNEINEKRQKLHLNIQENTLDVVNAENKINVLNNEIEYYANKINDITNSVENLKSMIRKVSNEKNNIETKFQKRVYDMYVNGNTSAWETILSSENMLDMINNYNMLKQVADNDIELISRLNNITDKYVQTEEEYKNKINILNQSQEKLLKNKKELESQIFIRNQKIALLSQDDLKLVEELKKLELERLAIEESISAELNKIGKIPRYVGGSFDWPVPSCRSTSWITAYYGENWKTGYPGSFHSGIDIAPPHKIIGQATANAVSDGRVIVAGYSSGGYGNYIVIDHGGDIYTLYGHASKLLVKQGDFVKKGDPILIIGSTGYSTGPHLHFEVRIGGNTYQNKVDPLPYITTEIEPKGNENIVKIEDIKSN